MNQLEIDNHIMIPPPLEAGAAMAGSFSHRCGFGEVSAAPATVPTAFNPICWDGIIKCALGMGLVRVGTALLGLFTCSELSWVLV